MHFWYSVKLAAGTYRLLLCLVLIVRMCELGKNWSLFLVINKSIEYIYCD
jgi:hypothetical protein